ncbi:DUF6263 family protein [Selenihalanaerobacter shriftii]|uniref:Uncharacterized protein n=1 Tax=Selenihalanaerobacter shriftii TaxID=142842 RepID=A0A1T4JK30_9FIRM|nr:DUF6263 family protein [Selenihalanaerobacter shriftii]SJZ30535.1 hypothetical protein SAMN02745118_00078 [Selenihalanaerobacter shriftii]
MKNKKIICLILVLALTITLSYATIAKKVERKYDLGVKFEKGVEYKLNSSIYQKVNQQMLGKNMAMEQTFDIGYTLKVKDIDSKNNYNLVMKYTKMDLQIKNIQNGSQGINSQELNQKLNNEMKKISKAFLNKKITITVSNKGNIINIEGYEKLVEEILSDMEDNTMKEKVLKRIINKNFIKRNWKQPMGYLPDHSVSIGESWENKFKMTDPLDITIITSYTLKDVKDDKIIIDSNSNIDVGNIEFKQEGMELASNFNGNQTGEIILDREYNWIDVATFNQSISGKISVGMKNQDFKLPVKIEMTTDGKLVGEYTAPSAFQKIINKIRFW